jgi:hypothetical protein
MPILIENNNYTNAYGYSGATYVSNAGDTSILTLTVAELIRVTTQGNPFSFDPIMNILSSPTVSWISEGIRVGDIVRIRKYTSAGVLSATHHANVTSVTATNLNLDTWSAGLFYDISANEIMEVVPVVSVGGVPRRRSDLLLEFNHALNNQIGSSASLIDGEKTQIFFGQVNDLIVSGAQGGFLIGNQSGQFLDNSEIEYIGLNADGFHQYEISIEFANSGVFNQDWFATSDCLKVFVRGLWASKDNEVFNRAEFVLDESANTGWFNEANNISIATGGSVVLPISELKFNTVNTVSFEVDLNGTDVDDLAIGGVYISTDDSYYKNKPTSQSKLSYLLPTTVISVGNTYTSNNNDGAEWDVLVFDIDVVSDVATVTLEVTFNSDFQTFIDARDEDRLFYIWAKVGNTNHLVFSEQLSKEMPTGGVLTMNSDYGFLDHAQNEVTAVGNSTGFEADIEDDLAYYGTFNLEKFKTTYENINVRIEAYNTTTDERFTLQQTNFSFASAIYQSSTGKYLLNQTQNINNELLNTSEKRNAVVQLTGVEDSESYEVSIYYPFLINWKYWQSLTGVNTDFAPDFNNDWFPYANTGAWEVRATIVLTDNGLNFEHSNTLAINIYDANDDVDTTIVLRKQSDNSVVTFIPKNEPLIIETTHVLNSGVWDLQKIWGQITVEPFENSPRWMLSSIIDFDNNINNPLRPISGTLLNLDFIFPNIIKFSCNFDSSKLSTVKNVKITAKIKQGLENIVTLNKLTTTNDDKETTEDELKILS